MKKFFRCRVCGDIHYGISRPDECPTCRSKDSYQDARIHEVQNSLKKIAGKNFSKCNICHDMHLGGLSLRICPACNNENSYQETEREEFEKFVQF